MLRYSEALHREFSSIDELPVAIIDPNEKGIKIVEPSVWQSLGITTLGHKLWFAKGLEKLAKQNAAA